MFQQLLTPVAGSLPASFIVAALPIAVVLVMLGIFRRPAWQASLGGLIAALIISVTLWQFPVGLAIDSVLAGATFALWPVMWIVFNALLLYNIAVKSGRFDAFRDWVLDHLPNDRRAVLIVIGFCFGALLEGISGFGTPVAITSSLLILVGYPPLEALVFTLIFNTAPVAFGALGVPITVLGVVTGLNDVTLGAMVGRQLPFFAICLPFYVIVHLWRDAVGAGALAAAARRGRQLRLHAVPGLELSRLCAHRRALLDGIADRYPVLPASMAPRAQSGVRDPKHVRDHRGGAGA